MIGALIDKSDREDKRWGLEPYPVFEQPAKPQRRVIPVKAVGKTPAKPAAKPRKF